MPNHPNIVIGEYFNLGDIDWAQEIPTTSNPAIASQHNKLLQILEDYSLTQHVKVPTRPVSGKTLDLFLSTYPNSISGVFTSTGLSDHNVVNFKVNMKPTQLTKPPHSLHMQKSKFCWSE